MKNHKYDLYDEKELEILREGGRILNKVLNITKNEFIVGKSTKEIDLFAERLIKELGAIPVFKNYKPDGASSAYPACICISINNEVAHGIPGDRLVMEGDIVSLDIGIRYKGLVVDSAISFGVGNINEEDKLLLKVGQEALNIAINEIKANSPINNLGIVIEKYVTKMGFNVIPILCGHGVGRQVHSEPQIPHIDMGYNKEKFIEGMVVAIEPHITKGDGEISLSKKDKWTYLSNDGKKAVSFEHTVFIGKDFVEILT